jgi:hypothetical protein
LRQRSAERTVRAVIRSFLSGLCPIAAALGLAAVAGCSPKIGDKCTVSTDCSLQGDRLCDPTQPQGYCTIFNCEPNRCPDEAVCVAFNEPSCASAALSRRFQRTFCMLVCESDEDCRAGYRCLDTNGDPSRQVVDINPQSLRICAVPASGAMTMPEPNPAVCLGPEAGAPPDASPDGTPPDAAPPDSTPEVAPPEAGPDASDDGLAGDTSDAPPAD